MDELNMLDAVSVVRRRKKLFLAVAGAVMVASLVYAFRYSNYRSVARIEVSQPEVALGQDGSGAGRSRESMADMQISYLQQKVLATGSLAEIISKFDLYRKAREMRPIAEVAESMRKSIDIKLLGSSLANPASAQKATAGQLGAIAFDISFDYGHPETAQKVANELVSRFLDEDIKQRRTQAEETSNFLAGQLKVLEENLAEQEKKIAAFKSTYKETRPEALGFNQQAATSLMLSLQGVETQITSNIGTQGALRAQLAAIEPYARVAQDGQVLTTPTVQLRALKSQYATLTSRYGASHPDVLKTSRQIEALEKQVGVTGQTGPIRAMIADAQTHLTAAEGKNGADNPDVIALRTKLASLRAQLETEQLKPVARGGAATDADNPAYLQVVSQLRASEEQGRALLAQKDALQAELDKKQQAIADNPELEQKLAALTRDYDNAQIRYRELKAKKMEADLSMSLEQDRGGQRLSLINPPEVPTRTQPSRLVFIVVGFVLSIMAGAASVVGAQLWTQGIMGARHLESIVGVAPLVVVPHLVTAAERREISAQHKKWALYATAGLVVALVLFSYFVMPLDVLMGVLALKLGL